MDTLPENRIPAKPRGSELNWWPDPTDAANRYPPSCASRAAEGFYSGALLGAVWGLAAHGTSANVAPDGGRSLFSELDTRSSKTPDLLESESRGTSKGLEGEVRAVARGVRSYGGASVRTAGTFGVFVGIVNAAACSCEHFRRERDWINSCVGGLAAGAGVALLSKRTRNPRTIVGHAVSAATITSLVAMLSGLRGFGVGAV